ncbi:hypothetical protein R3W88_022619 [Solanum pinnatisectum]|uniref:Maturase K n=1 Tax=Solanum pinnatisectum TaxID=50273 RepID=A0AAV9LV73_9SOLN|nr:hypothetical protein R3W88_022619 [Solanum pinnatisectum]
MYKNPQFLNKLQRLNNKGRSMLSCLLESMLEQYYVYCLSGVIGEDDKEKQRTVVRLLPLLLSMYFTV